MIYSEVQRVAQPEIRPDPSKAAQRLNVFLSEVLFSVLEFLIGETTIVSDYKWIFGSVRAKEIS
jgi:hypothetical protein